MLLVDDASEQLRKLAIFTLLNLHYPLFLIGCLIRYSRHQGMGLINLNEPRPRTYKFKIALQLLMALATLAMAVDFSVDPFTGVYTFEPVALVYVPYAFLWGLSIHLQFFEYKRNLPHGWYTHQAFWLLSFLLNIAVMASLFLVLQVYDFQKEYAMEIKYLVTHSIFIVVSAVLAYMGFRYKREHP